MTATKKTKKKIETVTSKNFPLRKRGDKWQVDFRKIGKGQMTFDTKAEAIGTADATCNQWMTDKLTGVDLTPARRKLALDAFAELREYGDESLADAVRLYKETYSKATEKKTVTEVIDEYLQSKAGSGIKQITLDGYADYMRIIGEAFGKKLVGEVQAVEIEKFLDHNGYKDVTRWNHRNHLSMLWRFAVSRNYAKSNPVDGVAKVKKQKKNPAILTVPELRCLLTEAKEYSAGIMLPYFAICALAGIRPHETKRLRWSHINLEEQNIYVEHSKTDEDRDVIISEALDEWLELVPKENRKGKIFFNRKHFDAIRGNAEVFERWKEPKGKDILRHSCASHHYRLYDDMNRTAIQMGHDVSTFRKFYKATVTKKEAREYFDVRPANSKIKIIDMKQRKTA